MKPAAAKPKAPAMPLYVGDYLSSSRVAAMTIAQEGAYVRLLMYQWQDGSIPADVAALAKLVRVSPAEMRKLWTAVAPCFRAAENAPGRLVNDVLETRRREHEEFRARQAAAGAKGNQRRWGRDVPATPGASGRDDLATRQESGRDVPGIAKPSLSSSSSSSSSGSPDDRASQAPPLSPGRAQAPVSAPELAERPKPVQRDESASTGAVPSAMRTAQELRVAALGPEFRMSDDEAQPVRGYAAGCIKRGEVAAFLAQWRGFHADPHWKPLGCPVEAFLKSPSRFAATDPERAARPSATSPEPLNPKRNGACCGHPLDLHADDGERRCEVRGCKRCAGWVER